MYLPTPSSKTTAVTAVLLAIIVCVLTTVTAQTALKNGDEFENIKYSSNTKYDANAKLKDETAYSSTVLWKDCTVSSTVSVIGTFDTTKTFATSLYLTVDTAKFSGAGQFDFFDLPPNSYVHAVSTTATRVTETVYYIRPTTETNNITAFIDDSTVSYVTSEEEVYVKLEVPIGSPYIVTHMRNARLTNTYAIFETMTCNDGSTIFLEKVTCTKCRWDLVWLHEVTSISKQSALILKEITIIEHTRPTEDGLIVTGDAVEVDESSVLAMVDIDLTHNFEAAVPLRLFYDTKLSGAGAIVLLRIKMGSSGLDDMQPADNSNFWVVAMDNPLQEMSPEDLREAQFNVNTDNAISWDGTGGNGECVQAGLALPNTAMYKLVNGKCEATCPQGNYLPPACTPRAVCTGVPNCQACYAHPKTMCLECLPHTESLNDGTLCKCPIRECVTCPSANACTDCSKDFKYSPEQKSCFHCTIDKCTICKEDGKCSSCEDGYKIYNNKCIACTVDKCESCSEPGKCFECIADHQFTSDGKNCVLCPIPGCKECNANNVCGDCQPGYTFVPSTMPTDNKCVRCEIDIDKCKTCKTDGVCFECITDHKLANKGKDCFHCTIPFCRECSDDGICGDCEDGYSLSNNKCVRCSADIEKCDKCKTEGICSECITDHKPANEGKNCFHCAIPFCKECSADGICGDCNDGYSLMNNKCVRCSNEVPKCHACKTNGICSECITGHKPANEGKNCFHCTIPFCKECSTDGVCGECEDGYSLKDNKCLRCSIDVPNCQECATEGVCTTCVDGDYTLSSDGFRCTPCQLDGCQRCDFPDVCALCDTGLSFNDAGECTPCDIGGCTSCSGSNTCALCSCGMVPSGDGKSCLSCSAANCKYCDPSDGDTKCAECVNGYELSDAGSCMNVGLPDWVTFVIVVVGSIMLMTAAIVAYILYQRHLAKQRQIAADAEERRKNRQAVGRGGRNRTEIAILDVGDIEDAASGVRDTLKSGRV